MADADLRGATDSNGNPCFGSLPLKQEPLVFAVCDFYAAACVHDALLPALVFAVFLHLSLDSAIKAVVGGNFDLADFRSDSACFRRFSIQSFDDFR